MRVARYGDRRVRLGLGHIQPLLQRNAERKFTRLPQAQSGTAEVWAWPSNCCLPCAYVPVRRWALFVANELGRELISELKPEPGLASFAASAKSMPEPATAPADHPPGTAIQRDAQRRDEANPVCLGGRLGGDADEVRSDR